MHIKIRQLFLAAAGALCLCAGAHAHHSFAAEFDVKSPVEFRGKVVKVELINPHSWIHVEVTRQDGTKEVWMVGRRQSQPAVPPCITKQSIPLGSELKVEGFQARDKGQARRRTHHHLCGWQGPVLRKHIDTDRAQ